LEQRLGVRLLQRSTRTLSPTSEGASYYEHVAAHLRAIEEAEDIVQVPGNVRGVLRVTVPTTFGRPLISAWAGSFLDRYPDIKLDLSVTDRRVDLIREGFDLAVRIGELEDTNLIGRSLGVLHYILAASPNYLQRRGIPRSVDDLKLHSCLRHLIAGRPQPFTFADGTRIVPDGPFDTDDAQSLIEAAVRGVGITQFMRVAIEEDLAAGRLGIVLPEIPMFTTPVHAPVLAACGFKGQARKRQITARLRKGLRFKARLYHPPDMIFGKDRFLKIFLDRCEIVHPLILYWAYTSALSQQTGGVTEPFALRLRRNSLASVKERRMWNANLIRQAIAAIWDELPELVGDNWEAFQAEMLALLRCLEYPEAEEDALSDKIVALFETSAAARDRLVHAIAQLMPSVQKSRVKSVHPLISERQRHLVVPVYYATDRADTKDARPQRRYNARGELSFGRVEISIPDDHRMGEIETPRWSWSKLEFRENPDKHVMLLSLTALDKADFVAEVRQAAGRTRVAESLIFVHGYNVSFEQAAQRAAQIAYDLGFPGVPMLYSWPSEGAIAGYTVDETNARWTEPHYRDFITLCLNELGLDAVHVIAHSMGSRVVAETLGNLNLPAAARARLCQLIFAAPDIDADSFRQLAAKFHGRNRRCTLYASSEDYAMKASKLIHEYPRAGDSGTDIVLVDGVDTIDATAVDTSLLGHSYVGDNRSILSDIFALLKGDQEPGSRFGLTPKQTGAGLYWLFKP
jgi:esterase/lipase superfamily enzyme/DNA-binding transcriptional LysR family regulator